MEFRPVSADDAIRRLAGPPVPHRRWSVQQILDAEASAEADERALAAWLGGGAVPGMKHPRRRLRALLSGR